MTTDFLIENITFKWIPKPVGKSMDDYVNVRKVRYQIYERSFSSY